MPDDNKGEVLLDIAEDGAYNFLLGVSGFSANSLFTFFLFVHPLIVRILQLVKNIFSEGRVVIKLC